MTRGEYITKLRKNNNYTQDYVADKLAIDRSTISKYEHDASEMSLEIMEDLSKIYNDQLINIIYGDENAYKNIENNIEKLHYDKYQSELNNIKLKKKLSFQILITIISSITLILLFFIYYFINTFNTIKVFRVMTQDNNDNNMKIESGYIILTSQNIYFNLTNINTDNKINKTEIYMNDTIINTKLNSNIITISDNIESQSHFNFKTIKKDINNLYIKVYTDDETITSKLILKKVYNNVNLFFKDKTYTNSIENDYLSKIIIDNLEINYHNVDNNTIKFINYDNDDTWTFQLNEKNINYRNKNMGLFQYNLNTNKYIFGKPNNEKLELFFKIYEKYKEIEGIS